MLDRLICKNMKFVVITIYIHDYLYSQRYSVTPSFVEKLKQSKVFKLKENKSHASLNRKPGKINNERSIQSANCCSFLIATTICRAMHSPDKKADYFWKSAYFERFSFSFRLNHPTIAHNRLVVFSHFFSSS